MKKFYIFLLASFLSLLSFSLISDTSTLLTYVESSSGLEQGIAFESGRADLKFADMNNDGYTDLLSLGDHGNPSTITGQHGIMVWFGNGTGANWNLFQYGNFGYGGICAGDINNDGKIDIGFGIHHNYESSGLGSKILGAALGDGTGTNWIAYQDSLAMNGETYAMFSSDFADIDNDGKLDFGSLSMGCCNGTHIYKNLGNGTWRQTFATSGGNSNKEFFFGDINNDGNIDFATNDDPGIPYFGDGFGNFTLKHNNLPTASTCKGLSIGDVDNDGGKDIAFIGSGGSVNVWKWNNSTQQWINLSANLPSTGNFQKTFLYDMNGDNFIDIVLYGKGNGAVYSGNGGTNWALNGSFSTPTVGNYQALTVADVDNNGFADIAVLFEQGSFPSYINHLKLFKETTPYTNLLIKPQFPKGFERLKNNQVRLIEWISSSPLSPQSLVKLEFSQTGNNGPWSLIKDSVKNNGKYQWIVPSGISSSNCFIKYTLYNSGGTYTALNQNPFSIGIILEINIKKEVVSEFDLGQNYPNPFNPSTRIGYQLASPGFVTLKIYDILGKEISTIVNEKQTPGVYSVEWNAADIANGVYFYRLTIDKDESKNGKIFNKTKKLIIIK